MACEDLTIIDYIEVGFGGYRYQIAVKDLSFTATHDSFYWFNDGRKDCDLWITPLPGTEKTIRLGDPFFVSFVPIFDVENNQLGLAMNRNAPERSTILKVDAEQKNLSIEQ